LWIRQLRGQAADGHAGHGEHLSRELDEHYLRLALALMFTFMVAEATVAVLSHSLVLLADAGHMLTDAAALALSIWAIRLSIRPATVQWTFGLKRAEILSAAVNGISLVIVAVVIAVEAVQRLVHPPHVIGLAVVIVASAGVVMNLAATVLISKGNRSNLNIAAAFAHLLTDLWAFLGSVGAGIIIIFTGYLRADAIASILIALIMLKAAWSILRDSGRILFEAAPVGIDLAEVQEHLLQVEHVRDVHDLHAWVVTSDLPALSAHVVLDDSSFTDGRAPEILDKLQNCLKDHFDLAHSTFQLESVGHAAHEFGLH
jgi:cobalt-zinc-cadmium efflux system protein